jgi:hypothetical protein
MMKQIPTTPENFTDLDLMKRLSSFANGDGTWIPGGLPLTDRQRESCRKLHHDLETFVNVVLAPILNRTTARELETFTMHDRRHGNKVAHLMWHIMKTERREQLTPPEISLLVAAAFFHDLGMALRPEDRARRLAPDSDLWERLEVDDAQREAVEDLRRRVAEPEVPHHASASEPKEFTERSRRHAELQLAQAYEALLTLDTRDRHSKPERYAEIIDWMVQAYHKDPQNLVDISSALSFEGDSFLEQLVSVCVSHNEDADALLARDPANPGRPRFPRNFPIGSCVADLQLVAAALRLADVLDFDRERTPRALFYYLLPTHLSVAENKSLLEWGKHLAISNWHIDTEAIVFKGRCDDHLIHHAIIEFGDIIAKEMKATRATFAAAEGDWPFDLPVYVEMRIHEEGYLYRPYKFQLDHDRIYQLLMGGAIYQQPLVAVRELIQNAVDACKLRDALSELHDEPVGNVRRIVIRYVEPTEKCSLPQLIVEDKGVGMDSFIIEQYFLQVGRSYYHSSEFNATRVRLRSIHRDFAPVAEFGIGFLSCFLLADRVTVETAMYESLHGDTTRRVLTVDGPTRLIRVAEYENVGPGRFKGTRITLDLIRGGVSTSRTVHGSQVAPTWDEIRTYLAYVCQDLPYTLLLEDVRKEGVFVEEIYPSGYELDIPEELRGHMLMIDVDDKGSGLYGKIAITNAFVAREIERRHAAEAEISAGRELPSWGVQFEDHSGDSQLLRGGFLVGNVPGLPYTWAADKAVQARLSLPWEGTTRRRYSLITLGRDKISDQATLARDVTRIWMSYVLEHADELTPGHLYSYRALPVKYQPWLEKYSAFELYQLVRSSWAIALGRKDKSGEDQIREWENGSGEGLLIGGDTIVSDVTMTILPRVCAFFRTSGDKVYVLPPVKSWRRKLKSCHTFISEPILLGIFVEFRGTTAHRLVDKYAGTHFFNARYKDEITQHFHTEELSPLLKVLERVIEAKQRGRRLDLNANELDLMRRAIDQIGDLIIGYIRWEYRIGDFRLK